MVAQEKEHGIAAKDYTGRLDLLVGGKAHHGDAA